MKLSQFAGEVTTVRTDLLVLGVQQDGVKGSRGITAVDRALRGALRRALDEVELKGKAKQKLVLDTLGRLRARRVAVVGLGREVDEAALLALGGQTTRLANRHAAASALIVVPPTKVAPARGVALLARGVALGGYRFDRYKSDKGRRSSLSRVALSFEQSPPATSALRAALRTGQIVADAAMLTRDLVNEPGITLYPESFADRARALAREVGLRCTVLGPRELAQRGMGLLLGVGSGSAKPPRLVHLAWQPRGVSGAPLVLVGKGITFDSGGLSLKQTSGMAEMKVDMAGAAAVLAAVIAAARLRLSVPVHAVMALAENMPSGTAIRVGDVIRSAAGKTVEITNTDAEGRLVLADALHFAVGLKPSRIVDVATLTGACVVALGPHTVGLFASDDELAGALLDSAARAGEGFWRLPLTVELEEQLKSEVADLKNTGERGGGAITAALFLKRFVGDVPWAHLDIAGPVTSTHEEGIYGKGATGVPVATLVEWLATAVVGRGTGSAPRGRRPRRV